MTLKDYYKRHIYDMGYNDGYEKKKNAVGDIYFEDECDYYICADYYGSYVGDEQSWTQEDIDFLAVLGFGTGDFEDD